MTTDHDRKIESWMFRVPNEYTILVFTVAILIGVGVLFSYLNIYIFAGLLLLGLVYIKLQQNQFMGNAVRLHQGQFPEIYQIFKDHSSILEISKAALYIRQDPLPNAFTIGITTPSVVLTSAIVEQFSGDELSFVIAHELGHIKAGHNIILSLINPLGNNSIWGALIFSFWQRKAEYSADRCGIILTKNIDSAITSMLKLSIGSNLFSKLDIKGYAMQMSKSESLSVKASELLADHPFTTNRIKNLLIFWRECFIKKQ